MASQLEIPFLLEAVLTNSCESSQSLCIKSKQLHHFLITSPNSVLRSSIILSTKLKNQQRVSQENFKLFEIYIKKILAKDSSAKLELTHSIRSNHIEKLKILSLFNFEKINIKRLNYSFEQIKQWVSRQNMMSVQRKSWRLLRVFNKLKKKFREKIACEVFKVLKTRGKGRFNFREKLLICKVLSGIIGNCKCCNEQVGLWKWKRWMSKVIYFAKGFENFNIESGFFNKFEVFCWVRNSNLCSIQKLRMCWERMKMRTFMKIKLDFEYWKHINQFKNLKGFNGCWVKCLKKLIRISKLFYSCRLKKEFLRLYVYGLRAERLLEERVERKRKNMHSNIRGLLPRKHSFCEYSLKKLKGVLKKTSLHYFYLLKVQFLEMRNRARGLKMKINSTEEDFKVLRNGSMADLEVVALKSVKNFTKVKLDRDKAKKHLRSGCKLKVHYQKTLKNLVDYMKRISISREKIQVRGIFTWINKFNNKNTEKNLRFFGFCINKSESYFKTCRWAFKKIKEYNKKMFENSLKVLARKAMLFKVFQSVTLKNWKKFSRVKSNNHRIFAKLKTKLLCPCLNLWKINTFSWSARSKALKNWKKNLTRSSTQHFISSFLLNKNIYSNIKFNNLKAVHKTLNLVLSHTKRNHQRLKKVNSFSTWRVKILQNKTKVLRKLQKIHKLALIFPPILQKHKLYFFSVLTEFNKSSQNQKFLLKFDRTLEHFLRLFFNKLVLYNLPPFLKPGHNSNLCQKFKFHLQSIIKNKYNQTLSDIIFLSTSRKLISKSKSVIHIGYLLKTLENKLKTESLLYWRSLFHSRYLKRKYILIVINSTSISYSTAFWRWINTIKKRYKDLHPKSHLLLSRLIRILKPRQLNTKFQTFLTLSAFDPEQSSRLDSKKLLLSESNDSESTQDKTNTSIYSSYSNKENKLFKSLGSAKVISFNLTKILTRKLVHAFCGLQYASRAKSTQKIEDLTKEKNSALTELRPAIWHNLDLKLRKTQITRQIKLHKKSMTSLLARLKTLKISQTFQLIHHLLRNSSRFSFIKLANN